jgi:hypothetical protein
MEDSTKGITIGLSLVFIFAIIMSIGWFVKGNDFLIYKIFAPKEEQVRREVFEESKSYNDGMTQELYSMQMDYIKANPDQKLALRSIILHRVSGYNISKFPIDLQQFITQLKEESK